MLELRDDKVFGGTPHPRSVLELWKLPLQFCSSGWTDYLHVGCTHIVVFLTVLPDPEQWWLLAFKSSTMGLPFFSSV